MWDCILCIVLVVSLAAAGPAAQTKIVGGQTAVISQYPSIVALLRSSHGVTFAQYCAGTILTTKAVLTAAHCVYQEAAARWRVRAGSTFPNSGGTVYTLSSILCHPNFNRITMDLDAAILRTSSAIGYSSVVQPAAIAGATYTLIDNQVVWAVGWGATSSQGATSDRLRHVQIWSVNQLNCASRYAVLGFNITSNMLCAGWLDVGGRDQCQGDSGGPVYHNGNLVGICSFGYGCASAQYPGVNTRVSKVATWVQNNA